jgi:beta-lactamase class A
VSAGDWQGDPRVTWSVQVRDADTDAVLLEQTPDTVLPAASVGKVLLLLEVARRLETGELDASTPLDRRTTPRVTDSGLWHRMATDVLPLRDVALLVASVSDNWATNVLVETVGLQSSGLLDLVRDVRGPEHPPALSLGNASAFSALMGRLHRRELPGASQVLDWLASGVDHSLVLSSRGRDPLVVDDLVLGKTGSDPGIRADVGLVRTSGRTVAYAAFATFAPELAAVAVRDLRRLGEQL